MALSNGHNRSASGARWAYTMAVVTVALATSACGPQISVLGSYFPSWMACLAIGLVFTFVTHKVLSLAGVDPNVGPKGLVYVCLILLVTLTSWLVLFRR